MRDGMCVWSLNENSNVSSDIEFAKFPLLGDFLCCMLLPIKATRAPFPLDLAFLRIAPMGTCAIDLCGVSAESIADLADELVKFRISSLTNLVSVFLQVDKIVLDVLQLSIRVE